MPMIRRQLYENEKKHVRYFTQGALLLDKIISMIYKIPFAMENAIGT